MSRAAWHLRANAPMAAWLVALLVVSLTHSFIPASRWLLIHLLLLGAVTNAIFVWSSHFTEALLRSPPGKGVQRALAPRLVVLNAGAIAVMVGVVSAGWVVVLIGAILVAAAVLWHGAAFGVAMRRALPSRFGATVRYYLVATVMLLVGVTFGVLLAHGVGGGLAWRLGLAHATANVLGWVGLTITGTLVTLWPTMLRTRVAPGVERASGHALVILLVALVVMIVAILFGWRYVAAAGVLGYLAGIVVLARPMVAEARQKPPAAYATWSVAAGGFWLVGSLVALTVILVSSSWPAVSSAVGTLVAPLAAGFVAQVLFGALSYLVPMALGGGPAISRRTTEIMNKGAGWRLTLINGGMILWLLPTPSLVRVICSALALIGFAAVLPVIGWSIVASRRPAPDPSGNAVQERTRKVNTPPRQIGSVTAALAVLVLGVAGGVAVDPPAAGHGTAVSAANGVTPTGHTTEVSVTADNMRFTPSSVDVPAGDRLIIKVTNTDQVVHDLVLATGQTSGRLSPGQSAQVDVGVVGKSIAGWCSLPGHRQLGMVFAVNVAGSSGSAGSMGGMDTQSGGESAASSIDLGKNPASSFVPADPTVAPAPNGTTHKLTLTVKDVKREVAPGVVQTLWTYNGTVPGPTLRGNVGDTFEITLVNDGDMAHSIDFHAGEVSPDEPMRSINPGQSLVYTFAAHHSGIWLYHCSTMPMSAHIANGMFGAVIIDPPNLAPVDAEYLFVQSEYYLGPRGGVVDPEKVATKKPDLVAFNGYANQYKYRPITAHPGERVRIWVLDAGPNLSTAFHVVGTQFDTVYAEGAYLLSPSDGLDGGSQVLSLSAAQGGFVELTFPAAGHYSFISHVMSDAEKGAAGVFAVS
ncbi:nitrite reductase (NO-forming) [Antricoccus suffuscus]|uniref:Copper-containing nitrite reductase n=1 Tax=Antricoccus suffuscus TaxID=1629062 RepID=A0A2T1A000_9ACTN|nr:multicopper oxidase domain-containing protein [Antricoccus suffuscus]PRZ41817.1 nitrite reductase (NO-forming) [Antricoccus suffuscus]